MDTVLLELLPFFREDELFFSRSTLEGFPEKTVISEKVTSYGSLTALQAATQHRPHLRGLALQRGGHHCQRLGLPGRHGAGWVQRAGERSEGAGRGGVRVVHGHAADDIGAFRAALSNAGDVPKCHLQSYEQKQTRSDFSSPGRVELALILRVCVAVNGDDAHRRTGGVRDYYGLGQAEGGAGRVHNTIAE